MKRPVLVSIVVTAAVLGGVACGELLSCSRFFRDQLGMSCSRGHLLAVVMGQGLYQADVERAQAESCYAAGIDVGNENLCGQQQPILKSLVANAIIQSRARKEKIRRGARQREQDFLRWQFRSEATWLAALHVSHLDASSVSQTLQDNLRARQWIERQINASADGGEAERRHFYDTHRENFFEPESFRASHLFLAAPPETAPNVVVQKTVGIEMLAVRLAHGEDFPELAAQNSEDEATKLRGGDLGYFSTARMPPDFVAAAARLRPSEFSPPIRTRLGFHIIKLTDVRPARQKTFDEVRSDIAAQLADEKRWAMIEKLVSDVAMAASYRP